MILCKVIYITAEVTLTWTLIGKWAGGVYMSQLKYKTCEFT